MLCYHKKQHLVKREDRLKSGKVTNQKQKFGKQKAEIGNNKMTMAVNNFSFPNVCFQLFQHCCNPVGDDVRSL